MKILQLSSIYDFEIPRCTTYIEEHLPEMLLLPQMINVTNDSIHLLFSDTRLSYMPMDDRLLFVLKWLDANPNTRRVYMKELLANLDFNLISNQCLQVCLNNSETACHIQSKHITTARPKDHRVLIMKEGNYDDVFWCLDLERDQWFRVESNSLKKEGSNRTVELYGTSTKTIGSIVCSVKIGYQEISLVILDLPLDTCTKMNFRGLKREPFYIKKSDNIKIVGHMCIISVNNEIKIKQNSKIDSDLTDIQHKLGLMSLTGVTSPDQLLASQMIKNKRTRTCGYTCITASTLYIGHIGESYVDMTPLLSFKDDEILNFAISDNALAIIFKSRKFVALYDLTEGHLERKNQTTSYNDDIAQIKGGFAIYDNKRCIIFTRIQDARPSSKYQVDEILLEQSNFQQLKYFICGQMMYRYYRIELKFRENFIFECTPFQTLVSSKSEEFIKWKELPLPKTTLCSRDTITERCFEIFLPKSILRCHVECPHCKKPSRLEASRLKHQQNYDDNYYDPLSDDDYYVHSYYDSEYDYNYDSDSIFRYECLQIFCDLKYQQHAEYVKFNILS
jgi:hypothetical protein